MSFNPEAKSSEEAKRYREAIFKDFQGKGITPNPYELELSCFKVSNFGTDLHYEFCLNCCQMQWDWLYLEKDGIENFWFKRIIKACCKYKKVLLMGTISSGKTFSSSAYCYTKWKCQPWATSVYLSTTTKDAGDARTWGAVKDLHAKDKYKIGNRIDYRQMIVLEEEGEKKDRDYRDSITCVCIREGAEGENAVASICGRKNESVIWHCDEYPFMSAGARTARGSLYQNPFNQFIGAGNKPKEGDPMYLDATPDPDIYPEGWETPGLINKWFWRVSGGGVCLYFDGEKSPNLEAPPGRPAPFPRLATREGNLQMELDYGGRDSPEYWRFVRGFPVSGDIQDTVLTVRLLESNQATDPPHWMGDPLKTFAGLDLGFRAEGDPCVADFIKLGRATDGRTIMAHENETVILRPKMSSTVPFEDQIAHAFIDQARERDCHYVCPDISGDGGITAQALVRIARERNYQLTVVPISFSGTADEDAWFVVGGKRKKAKELFDRKVSQLWYSYRLSVQNGVVRGSSKHSRAVKQFCQRKVGMDEKKRWSVEPKKEMKKRTKRSPDDADARVLAHEAARRNGLSQEKPKEEVDQRLVEARKRQQSARPAPYRHGHGAPQYAHR